MKLEYAFVADAATMLPNGTFDVIAGGFDVVAGRSFPAVKAAIVFIARILFDPSECGRSYEFTGDITDGKGEPIYTQFRGAFTPLPHARHPNRANWYVVCLNAQGVKFPTPGDYSFRLLIDGKPVAEVALEAVLEENPR